MLLISGILLIRGKYLICAMNLIIVLKCIRFLFITKSLISFKPLIVTNSLTITKFLIIYILLSDPQVGQMGLIETIVRVSRLAFSLFSQSPHQAEGMSFCDLLIETWSTLWNITGTFVCLCVCMFVFLIVCVVCFSPSLSR